MPNQRSRGRPRSHARAAAVALVTFLALLVPPQLAAQRGAGASEPAVSSPAVANSLRAVSASSSPASPSWASSPNLELLSGLRYRMIGPARGGRVTAVAGHRAQRSTFYFGSTGGGVWKTTDYGATWTPLTDGQLETASIGSIAVAESDPDIIYVGTGSAAIRSNVIAGRGVYRSSDAGRNWTLAGLRGAGQIGSIVVHPTTPDLVYAAALGSAFGPGPERGVFRSRDGGQSWEKVLFVSDSTGAVNLAMHPSNPRELYASMWRGERKPWTIISGAREGGIWRTTDGGDTWQKVAGGLPEGVVGKSMVAYARSNPRIVYAIVEAPGRENGVYRSDDGGVSWRHVSNQPGLLNRPFYYTYIHVDPHNAEKVYVNNEAFFVSTDGGRTFERRPTPHVDNHGMWINPDEPDVFIQSNDGGVNVTHDGGRTWSTQYNQPTAELYQVNVDDQFPYRVYGAQQDNSTLIVASLPPMAARPDHPMQLWQQGAGCETGPILPHPQDSDIVYGACKGRFMRLNLRTGQEKHYYVGAQNMYGHNPRDLKYRFQRVAPIVVSPHDSRVIYHASQYLHRTVDEGVTWETISPDLTANDPRGHVISGSPITRDITGEEFYSTIYAVAESPRVPGLIWVGANDGPVHVTRDGGASWAQVTPLELPPGGRVQYIEPSPHDAAKAYIAVYRYLLDDWQPYIYRTTDHGRTWTRLTTGTNGVPADYPTRVIKEDPDRAGLLYAGTEFGIYISFDDGASWHDFQLNLPRTPITDMKIHRKDLVLATMGRSFWILDNLTPLHQHIEATAANGGSTGGGAAEARLFAPREAYRMRYGAFASAADAPEFVPRGAAIDYVLGETPRGPVTLDILDERGTIVRSFSSEAADEHDRLPARPMVGDWRLERAGTPRLQAGSGAHRFYWDLAHAGPWSAEPASAGRGGPMVAPGSYRVRLEVDGASTEQPLVVHADPRVLEDDVSVSDIAGQVAFQLAVRDAISDARLLSARVGAARERLRAAAARESRTALQELDRLHAALESETAIRYPQPMLVAQLQYLYAMNNAADQKLGHDARARFAELRAELEALQQRAARVLTATQ